MNIRFLLSLATILSINAVAENLTPEQALHRVADFTVTRSMDVPKLLLEVRDTDNQPSVYVFDNGNNDGFMIVSANDVAIPLLGYSESGNFNKDNMPPAMKYWLHEYSRQIDYAEKHGVLPFVETRGTTRNNFGARINPMLKTKWNQTNPYNLQCPVVNGMNCVTGCVATAMAQVMKYHNYPEFGKGEVAVEVAGIAKPLTLDLSAEKFSWTEMRDEYITGDYSENEANAVAYLMKACGYSVDMDYTTNESGAIAFNIGKALIDNFDYNPNISYVERKYYNETTWGQLIYEELAGNRPVIYGGHGEGGGHQFVCDGYDGNGYFHINWGWGGISDGYFLLSSLDPNNLGVGGGTGGGFSFDQSFIYGVQPKEMSSNLVSLISQDSYITGNTSSNARITLKCQGQGGWWNMTYQPIKVSFGVILENLDNPSSDKQFINGLYGDSSLANVNFASLTGLTEISFLFPSSLPDGKYKATVAYKNLASENGEYYPVACPEYYSNSVHIAKSGSSYKITYDAVKNLTVVDCELITPLYYQSYSRLSITLKNDTDVELTQTIAPALLKQGEYWFVTDGIPVNLKPGESITREVTTMFNQQSVGKAITQPTTFSMKILDLSTGKEIVFSKSVEMQPSIENEVKISNMSIAGAECDSNGDLPIFYVADTSTLEFSADLECVSGYFGEALYGAIMDMDEKNILTYQPMTPIVTIAADESCKVNSTIYFDKSAVGMSYKLCMGIIKGNGFYALQDGVGIITVGTSSVDLTVRNNLGILYDKSADVLRLNVENDLVSAILSSIDGKSYNLTECASSGIINLYQLPHGIYIVRIFTSDGKCHILKFIK